MKSVKIFFILLLACAAFPLPFARGDSQDAATAQISLDYSQEKGKFSKYLFGAFNAPYYDEKGLQLIKDANFKIVAIMDGDLEQKQARALEEGRLDGAIFYSHNRYLGKQELEKNIQALLNKIDSLKKRYPGFEIKIFLFANEPDLPEEQLFENYSVFARYLKMKNPEYIVGGLGFAAAFYPSGKERIKNFIEYADKNRAPLDFIAYHAYSYEIKEAFSGTYEYIQGLLESHPGISPLFGTAKIALTEMDIQEQPLPQEMPCPQMRTDWRAAHNILALSALAEKGLWMSCEKGGPFQDFNDEANFLWVNQDATIQPVYYAHKAFNALAGTIRIGQEGSDFQTFGALAGKSPNNDALYMVISNYDEGAFRRAFSGETLPPPPPEFFQKSNDLKTYRNYSITVKKLPWSSSDIFLMERYAVDQKHNLELIEISEMIGSDQLTIERDISLPQVQLIKIHRK
ncbi:MAG: hypothetical protein PHN57_03370 [Candidatus Omnitrophica bacterium]|nr:hypothetical protein [Candidatus Omnitrophota bacterium]